MRSQSNVGIAACAAAFILVLAVSAYWDASIRVLHVFESVPYLVAALLSWRRAKAGYAVGFVSGVFWLWCAGFLTTFLRNGFERLSVLVRTGSVDRPDILIAVPAAIATAGIAFLSVASYAREPKKGWKDVLWLGAASVIVPAYFVTIFYGFAPQYLEMFRRLVR